MSWRPEEQGLSALEDPALSVKIRRHAPSPLLFAPLPSTTSTDVEHRTSSLSSSSSSSSQPDSRKRKSVCPCTSNDHVCGPPSTILCHVPVHKLAPRSAVRPPCDVHRFSRLTASYEPNVPSQLIVALQRRRPYAFRCKWRVSPSQVVFERSSHPFSSRTHPSPSWFSSSLFAAFFYRSPARSDASPSACPATGAAA